MSSSDRWDERQAERIVAAMTGGQTRSRDIPGAASGTHDFDVVLSDGRIVAVEVTRHTARTRVELLAAVYECGATEEQGWVLPGLACSWLLSLDPYARVRNLHAEIETLLAVAARAASQDGHDRFRPRLDSRLYELGVRAAFRIRELQPPQVVCAPLEEDFDPAVLGPPTGGVMASVVEKELARKAEKLRRADADERHLFIWVDFSQKTVLADMEFTGIPRTTPKLPASIEAVWLVDAFCPGRVRTYRPADGWSACGSWSTDDMES